MEQLKPLIAWLHLNPQWGGVITFLFAFFESIAIFGLFVPGSIIMSAVGVLIGSGVLPLVPTLLWGISGAILGDILSYGTGLYYRENIRKIWPFSIKPHWLDKGEKFFREHGRKGVFLGRFIGPIRPIIPLTAGTLNMSLGRFLFSDISAAILWAPLYMLPGFLIGLASMELAPTAATHFVIDVLIFLLSICLLFWLIKLTVVVFGRMIDASFVILWEKMQSKKIFSPLTRMIQITHMPEDHTQIMLSFFFFVSLIGFVLLTWSVVDSRDIFSINHTINAIFRSIYHPNIEGLMIAISYLGSPKILSFVWLCIFGYLSWRRMWFTALHWLLLGLLALGFTGVIKRFIGSPRPVGLLYTPISWSYPSGHATLTAAFYTFFSFMVSKGRSRKVAIISFCITGIVIVLMGATRLYLGVHWFTDVLGGILLGLTLAFGITVSFKRCQIIKLPLKGLLSTTFISLLFAVCIAFFINFERDLIDYTPIWPKQHYDLDSWWQIGINGKPSYRENRLGELVQTMNVEWVGNINQIATELMKQGWSTKPNWQLMNTIKYIGSSNRAMLPPLLPKVFNHRHPTLVMTKLVGDPPLLLILRLWQSDITLYEAPQKLYLGTLNFRYVGSDPFFVKLLRRKKTTPIHPELSAMDEFAHFLDNFSWKTLPYPQRDALNDAEDRDWEGKVLLIRPKIKTLQSKSELKKFIEAL